MKEKEYLLKLLRLYVIPDRIIGAPLSLEEQTRLALEGGATAIQLRDKSMDGKNLLETARRMMSLCWEKDALFIVNDRLDVALLINADGVHLGQSDLPVAAVREMIDSQFSSRPFIIGASAHRVEEAKKAEGEGADYLGVGAVFGTGSKDDAKIIGLDGLRAVTETARLPVVAIGGISLDNLSDVVRCGVDGISVISAAVRGDVTPRTAALKRILDSAT
jgi:thiamine-phosphate pyrophosphorylase